MSRVHVRWYVLAYGQVHRGGKHLSYKHEAIGAINIAIHELTNLRDALTGDLVGEEEVLYCDDLGIIATNLQAVSDRISDQIDRGV